MAQKSYDSGAGWHCQAETSAFIRFLNDCCSAVAYLQEAIAYTRLYRKTVLNSTDLQDRQDEFKYDFLQKCMRISKNHCNFYKKHIFFAAFTRFQNSLKKAKIRRIFAFFIAALCHF